MFTFTKKYIMAEKLLVKDTTDIIAFRIPKKLKKKLKNKYGRTLSKQVVPLLESLCG